MKEKILKISALVNVAIQILNFVAMFLNNFQVSPDSPSPVQLVANGNNVKGVILQAVIAFGLGMIQAKLPRILKKTS